MSLIVVAILSAIAIIISSVSLYIALTRDSNDSATKDEGSELKSSGEPKEQEKHREIKYIAIQGGLGNQLFQISAVQRLAEKYDAKPVVYTGIIENPHAAHIKYYPEIFDPIIEQVAELPDGIEFSRETKPFYYTESDLSKEATCLFGYYQHPNYIMNRDMWVKCARKWTPYRLPKGTAVIHVRRGDYVNLGITLPINYYMNIIDHMREDSTIERIWVFTNDTDWCKEHFADLNVVNTGFKDYEDMALMSTADSIAISNSTFSWWSAFMSDKSTVYAPSEWLISEVPDSFYPSNWNVVPIK